VLTGSPTVAKRRCNDDEERWRLELNARAKEGKRELKSEGERCGMLRGVELTFYSGRGSVGEATTVGNQQC
jgi:hypothetical protein